MKRSRPSRLLAILCGLFCLLILVGCDCAEDDSTTAFGPDCGDSVMLDTAADGGELGEDETPVLGSGNLIFSDVGDGSVRVLENFSSAEGETATDLPLSGSNTGLLRPQNLSIHPTTQGLIVPDEGESAIYFFDNTEELTGNVFPSRILQGPATELSAPVHAVVDSATDELYVLDRSTNQILVYLDASTLDGELQPDRIIGGPTTTIQNASALLLIPSSNRLVVINPSEILTFDNLDTLSGDPAPVGRVNGAATTFQNLVYGRLTSEGTLILADQGTNSILFFENFEFEQSDVAPTRTLNGQNTGIQSPTQFALSGGELYLGNGFEILVFNDLDTLEGNPFPTRRIQPTNPPATTIRGLTL